MGLFSKDSLQIIVFQSYGTENKFFIRGRALEDEKINLQSRNILKLLINSWKRFESDEIKNTELTVTLPNNLKIKTITDNHGYFKIAKNIENLYKLVNSEGWLYFEISFSNSNFRRRINNSNKFKGELLIPPKTSDFGIISDIDDTILHTGVISKLKWKVLFNTFFKSPYKRKALEGTSIFYHKLHRGTTGKKSNPLFYVSHSPWNLYRYLEIFLNENKFPKGAILLRSFADIFNMQKEKPEKQREILEIFSTYPDMSFILIGDAGEHDIDIYMEITKMYPEKVKAIYLRSVKNAKKTSRIKELTKNYKDTSFLLVDNTQEAIAHAKKFNFIQ
ncbi:phosphatase domain-containing protein [uncultured Polaribacter sp.]|uniref:App1 family protein n=1 Tax=uncultured Polaribacter sp. TaxID=174711 RepID=UPI002610EEAE|nr:phosphatase domain-containing protein [uncultured Polaribacter sp.]